MSTTNRLFYYLFCLTILAVPLLMPPLSSIAFDHRPLFDSPLPSPRATVYGIDAPPPAPTGNDPNATPSQHRRISLTPASPLPTPTPIPDFIPPQTAVQIAGMQGNAHWYRSPVSVTFVITDNFFAGVTEYQLDQTTAWTYREYHYQPVTIHDEGVHSLRYRSIDIVENIEAPQITQIGIDRTTPQAAAPRFEGNQLPNGWYNTPVTITMQGSDALAGLAGFERAKSTGDWATSAAQTVITATGYQTLTWRAVDNAGNVSPAQQTAVLIDLTPPTTTHALATLPVNGWYTRPVTVALSAVDVGAGLFQSQYRVKGAPGWQIYGAPFVVNEAGVQTVEYRSSDRALNLEPVHTITLPLDLAAPVLAIAVQPTPVAGVWSRTGLTLTAQATDTQSGVAALAYTVDDTAWQPYSAPLALTAGAAQTIRFRAIDHAGHVAISAGLTLGVDGQPPTTTLHLSHRPNAAGWFNQPITLTLVATDTETGLFQTQYQWQEQRSPAIYQQPLALSQAGRHTLTWFSVDRALNQEQPHTQTLNLDWIAPTITYTIQGTAIAPGWYQSAATLHVTATDALAGIALVEYRLAEGNWQPYAGALTVTGGSWHTVQLRARDQAANQGAPTTVAFGIDTLAPQTTVQLTGGRAPNGWYITPVTVTLTTTDIGAGVAAVNWRLNGGSWQPYGGPWRVATERVNLLEYYAVDKVGNQEGQQYSVFSIDLVDPTTRLGLVQGISGDNGWYISPLTLTLSAQDLESGLQVIEYRVNDQPWQPYSSAITLQTEGVQRIHYRAGDASGHVEATRTLTVSLDLTPPIITNTLPTTMIYGALDLTNFYTATDRMSGILTTNLRLNGQSYQAGQSLPLGTYTVAFQAVDRAGHNATRQQTVRVLGRQIYLPIIQVP